MNLFAKEIVSTGGALFHESRIRDTKEIIHSTAFYA